jgi:predicted regulator of Ras-like GTPase activity (Roadblock/LC7/MglB family)
MDFRETLQEICSKVKGSIACSLMGFDGIPVETVELARDDLDVTAMLVEYTNIFQQVRQAAEALKSGAMQEAVIRTERLIIILRLLTDNYFLALLLEPSGHVGQGRYRLRVKSADFLQELY